MKPILLFIVSFFTQSISAQNHKITGTWQGKISVGIDLRIVFNFKDSAGNITGTSDSPDQGVKGIPLSNIITRNDSLLFDVPNVKGSYAGKFVNDSTITGELTQGRSIGLILKKTDKVAGKIRPQTPQLPFPYISEDVEYDNADRSIHFGATITIPKGTGTFPAVILITGSGAQNRDEEILEHKPFAVIADHLTKNGFIVLRVDDRGTGKTSQGLMQATTADFAKDVNASLDYLKTRKEVNLKKLGLIGHSEGGMIAPMVATQRNDIKFIVLLAAPGEKIAKLMEDQNAAILLSGGMPKNMVDSYLKLYRKMIPAIINAKNINQAKKRLTAELEAWKKITPKNTVIITTGITNEATQNQFINTFAESISNPWYKYFLQFDPQPYLIKLQSKVLALNGGKDIQIIAKPNLAAINAALNKSKSPLYEVKELPGLNHLFQHCKKCTVNEYGELEETFSTEALQIITNWLLKAAK